MVSAKSVEEQLKKLHFNRGWNGPEIAELATILLPDEEIFECVNGWYEGGFALLCATNVRVLLIDKKPFKFLNVEDVRFDTINQIDYFHRMFNASICISAGLKKLLFRSYNQPRLRKLITHVQHRMAEIKTIEQADRARTRGDVQEMDQQLRSYLVSQYEQHQSLRRQHEPSLPPMTIDKKQVADKADIADLKSLIASTSEPDDKVQTESAELATGASTTELYEDGINEIFGKYQSDASTNPVKTKVTIDSTADSTAPMQLSMDDGLNLDTNPLKIAYSKLPQILRARKTQPGASY